jgi:hypothetical protein
MEWPADRVERRGLASLIPSARNARTHSDAQVAQLAASIAEWGWTMPVLVDEAGSIIAGHGRVLAAARMGLDEVPTMVARGWSEAQKRAYVIADNKLTENGGWDDALLRVELQDLEAMGFDALLTGFSAAEIKALGTVGKTDPDEVPAAPVVPMSKPGDVWLLGDHRLACGDATIAADVELALGGSAPHLMVTDPPYGVDYDPAWRNRAVKVEFAAKRATGKVENDKSADWARAWTLFPGDVAYVWHASMLGGTIAADLNESGFASQIADHLGQATFHHWPRRLSLATRAVLVRGAQERERSLDRRSHAVDDLADPFADRLGERATGQ